MGFPKRCGDNLKMFGFPHQVHLMDGGCPDKGAEEEWVFPDPGGPGPRVKREFMKFQ